MAELKIDIDGINNKVIPPLNKAKIELESAASSLSAISYSPDYYKFTNRSRVQSVLPQNIRNIKTNVNNINKWLGEIENRFKNADKKSNTAVNSLVSQMENIDLSLSISKTGGNVKTVTNSAKKTSNNKNTNPFEEGWNNVGAWISNGWNGICSFAEQSWNNVCATVSNGWNSICSFGEEIWNGVSSFAQEAWNTITSMASEVEKAINSVGAHISSAWNSFWTDVWPNIWDGIQSTAASVSNVVIGFVKGLGQFIESLVDLVVILGTAIGSIGTGIYDGISYLVSLANGTSDEWESVTGAMWGNVMGFVAEDHVGNAFADFYKNNVVGQWLDEHAIDACKSDGIVTNVASGLGYVAGIIALTVGTLGIGTAVSAGATTMSFATTSAVVAAAAGTGKYTQEAWGNMRDSSWEGIERMHEKGEITEEQYESYIMVRNLTDEQWAEIEEEYKSGAISEEEYEAMKQIREIPEDWKTFENGAKGLFYGVANGVWEGVQWYVGGKLAGWAVKGHQVATSAVRVGADTAFNGLDTPFRTAMDTITYGKTWDQAWEEQGGWQSLLTNIGIGLVGSAGGEIFDGVKLNKASKVLDQSQIFDGLDETTAKELKDSLLYAQQTGKINLSKLDDATRNNLIEAVKTMNLSNLSKKEMNNFFDAMEKMYNNKAYKNLSPEEQKTITENLVNDAINKKLNLFDDTAKQPIKKANTKIKDNFKDTIGFKELDNTMQKKIMKDIKTGKIDVDNLKIYESAELIEKFNMKYPETMIDGKRTFQNATQIAEYFNDPYGFIVNKCDIDNKSVKSIINKSELVEKYYDNLSLEDKNTFLRLLANQRTFSQEQKDLLRTFSKYTGPVYSAYARNAKVEFDRYIFDAVDNVVRGWKGEPISLEDYVDLAYKSMQIPRKSIDIGDEILRLDNIIESSEPLKESILVTRNVDAIFKDGDRILIPSVGDRFNDKAIFSTSADAGNAFTNRKIKLEIEVPAGEKVAYIESEVAYNDGTAYHQQEILLGRNSTYEIIDVGQFDTNTNQLTIKARLVPQKKSIIKELEVDKITSKDVLLNYYDRYYKSYKIPQVDLSKVVEELQEGRLLSKYEVEIRDLRNSGFYKEIDRLPEHGVEHVERVLFNAMYIGQKEGLSSKEMSILIEASKFHDCSREVNGINHGINSAINSEYYLSIGYKQKDINIMQAAMEYHAIKDNADELSKILDKYNIAENDREMTKKIAVILKDADALDRNRFPGNLKEEYLRTDTAKEFIKASCQIHELSGTKYLNDITNSGKYDIEIINNLRKEGFSDFEIAFWIKNNPSNTGYVMPVWQNIDRIINETIKKGGY